MNSIVQFLYDGRNEARDKWMDAYSSWGQDDPTTQYYKGVMDAFDEALDFIPSELNHLGNEINDLIHKARVLKWN